MKNINTCPAIHPGQILFRFLFGAMLLLAAMGMGSSRVFATLSDYQAAVTSTASLISYYTFEQTNANDSVGPYNGTPINPAYAPGAEGYGQGFLCNGTAQVNFGTNSDFEFPSGSGTIEAWIRADWTTAQGGNPTLWADGNGYPTEYSIHMSGTATKNGIGFWNGAAYNTLPIPAPGTNWHHLVTVFDGGTFTVYWDGQFAATENQILGFNPYQFELGNSNPNPGGGEGWIGMLDEVAIYSTALSSNIIRAHYQAFFSNTPPVIVKQPAGGAFLPGVTLTLSVTATGPNLTYQWFKGTGSLLGQTNTTLILPSLSAGDVATYHVVVSNSTEAVTSDNATVALGTLPTQLTHYQTAVSNEPGLISYYTFDRLTANDVFGPNNGTLQGSATFASGVGGDAGKGLLLDGSGRVNLGSVPSFDFASGGTVEGWIRADWTSVGYEPCMFADRNGAPTVWSIHLNSAKDRVSVYNGSGSSWFYPPASAGTNWHHIATVFTNGTVSVYWDGALIIYSPLARALGPGPGTVQLGSSASSSTSEGWIGMLDDVAFYSNALSAAQVKAHYDAFYQGVLPVITVQPTGGDFLPGLPFTMSAQAQGADLVYQWYKDNSPIPDATNLTISTPSLAITNTGVYYFTASNSVGVAKSSNAVLTVNADVARYQATVLSDPDLISYYTFDAADATDSFGTNNGTLVGSVTFTNGPGGVTNKALLLNGSSWINLGAVHEFDLIDLIGGTVEAWINPGWTNTTGLTEDPDIIAERDDSGPGGAVWDIHMYEGRNGIGNWNNIAYHGVSIPQASGWHHLAVTFSGGADFGAPATTTVYWDGQLAGSVSQPVSYFVGQTTQIGNSDPSQILKQPWIGTIDEVALYGAVLSATEINDHYLAMIGPEPGPTISYLVSGNQITLSWPISATGYTLESSPSLAVPNWTVVGGVVSNSVTVTISSGNQFFRLTK
jgi:hypothetical protein